jgi:hypothetical protein
LEVVIKAITETVIMLSSLAAVYSPPTRTLTFADKIKVASGCISSRSAQGTLEDEM